MGLTEDALPLSLTVVCNCHCYERTYRLKNLCAWQSNLLKPDFNYWKGFYTNSLTLRWKTKGRQLRKICFCSHFIYSRIQYPMVWHKNCSQDGKRVNILHTKCTGQGTNAQLPLPFWGLLTHPQRAVDTDVQSWWVWVALAILKVESVEMGKVVLPKYILHETSMYVLI